MGTGGAGRGGATSAVCRAERAVRSRPLRCCKPAHASTCRHLSHVFPPAPGTPRVIPRSYPHPILAAAQSNVAVDNLLEGLLGCGVGAVRTGQPVKVREALRDATLDARILAHPARPAIEEQQVGEWPVGWGGGLGWGWGWGWVCSGDGDGDGDGLGLKMDG